jgi:hypothetical protein
MAEQQQQREVNEPRPGQAGNFSPQEQPIPSDDSDESTLERVELLVAGANQTSDIEEAGLGEKLDELAATTDEEVDALRINLLQEDERANTRDGSGRVVDDAAEARIAKFTESDPMQGDLGAVGVEPGRDDTSSVLRKHHPDSSIARSDAIVEGNLDEPIDETITDAK